MARVWDEALSRAENYERANTTNYPGVPRADAREARRERSRP